MPTSLETVIRRYLRTRNLSSGSRDSYFTTLRKWNEWKSIDKLRDKTPVPVEQMMQTKDLMNEYERLVSDCIEGGVEKTMVGRSWEIERLKRVISKHQPTFAKKGVAEGRLHPDLHQLYLMRGFHPGTVFCNSVVIRGVDGTDPAEVSRATQEGRRRCAQLAEFLVADVPGFEAARMANLGPTVGVRETRKLQGMYRVTGPDLRAATKFDDGVVACDNPIDDVMRGEMMTHDAMVSEGAYYTIPFRALVPEKIENLMFAGRIISADAEAFASVRGMPQCMLISMY